MDIHIFSLEEALDFVPSKPTYAIRIFSKAEHSSWLQLKPSEFYKTVATYVFDDNDEFYQAGPKTIDDATAASIVTDFAKHRDEVDALLVHCIRGKNRSPAVAIALNKIFRLGADSDALEKKYPAFNDYVHQLLLKSAKTSGLYQ